MPIYWGFDAELVAKNVRYYEQLRDAKTIQQVSEVIKAYRAANALRIDSGSNINKAAN
jgi:hypothetical protein